MHGADIMRKYTQPLDRVDAKSDIALFAQLAQFLQIGFQAAGKLHRADRQQARRCIAGIDQRLFQVAGAGQRYAAHLDALPGKRFPHHAVRREFLVADDHVVTRLPGKPVGNHRQSFGRIFQQRDIVSMRGADQFARQLANVLFRVQPGIEMFGTDSVILPREFDHCIGSARRPRGYSGVIQVNQVTVDREFVRDELFKGCCVAVHAS